MDYTEIVIAQCCKAERAVLVAQLVRVLKGRSDGPLILRDLNEEIGGLEDGATMSELRETRNGSTGEGWQKRLMRQLRGEF